MDSGEERIIKLKIEYHKQLYDLSINTSATYPQLSSKIEELIKTNIEDCSIKLPSQICIPRDDPLLNNLADGTILTVSDPKEDEDDLKDFYDPYGLFGEVKEAKVNLRFFDEYPSDDEDVPIINLTGMLKLCLLQLISYYITDEQLNKISLKDIIKELKTEMKLNKETGEEIKSLLSDNSGNNLLEYAKYVNEAVKNKEIDDLINILDKKQKEDVKKYWKTLSKYQKYNEFFEEELSKNLKESFLDYSVKSLAILSKQNKKKYEASKSQCPNVVKRILYHGTQIDVISKIMTDDFKYTKKAFYGMGIYFSDMLDYVGFYAGGTNFTNRRENFGKILPINTNFSLIASEIYYDSKKFKKIENLDYKVQTLDDFPTYDEIKTKYKDKMVQKNGIHFVNVEPYHGKCFVEEELQKYREDKGGFVGNEYVITEKIQMLPLYCLTLERNEYFILWRDPNFKGNNRHKDFLNRMKIFANKIAKMNMYIETQTEEALKIIERKKFNKIILISSGGLDKGGKKFIEVARKILKFNVVILFFSANQRNLEWIKKLPNVLYTRESTFYEEYITNFTKDGLNNLKTNIEKKYQIKLPEFTKDFIDYPLFKNEGKYGDQRFIEKYDFFRHVKIFNENNNKYLGMNNGKPVIVNQEEAEKNIWDITIMDKEITLCCNEFYLKIEEGSKNVTGFQYMVRWNFSVNDGKYIIFSQENKNDVLTIESGNSIKVTNGRDKKNTIFEFIDII